MLDHVVNSNQREVFERDKESKEKNSEFSQDTNSLRVSDESKVVHLNITKGKFSYATSAENNWRHLCFFLRNYIGG